MAPGPAAISKPPVNIAGQVAPGEQQRRPDAEWAPLLPGRRSARTSVLVTEIQQGNDVARSRGDAVAAPERGSSELLAEASRCPGDQPCLRPPAARLAGDEPDAH